MHAKSTFFLGSAGASLPAVERRASPRSSSFQALPQTKPLTFLTACRKNLLSFPSNAGLEIGRSYIGSRNGLAFSSKTLAFLSFASLPGDNT